MKRDKDPATRVPGRRLQPTVPSGALYATGPRLVRAAVVGTGWGVRAMIPALRSAGIRVDVLCGRNEERTKQHAARLGVPRVCTDVAKAASGDDVDLVIVSTPPFTHSDACVAALRAGKSVLTEKPMCGDAEQREAMMEAWATAKATPSQRCLALVDFELRFLPIVHTMRSLVRGGKCGTVLRVEGVCNFDFKADPSSPHTWWFEKEKGGGALGGAGVHLYDLACFVTGSQGRTVSCTGIVQTKRRPVMPTPSSDDAGAGSGAGAGGGGGGGARKQGKAAATTADDMFAAQLLFKRDITVHLSGSFVHRLPDELGLKLTVIGSTATLVLHQGRLFKHSYATGAPKQEEISASKEAEAATGGDYINRFSLHTAAPTGPAQSSMFYQGLSRMAHVLRRTLELGEDPQPWQKAGGVVFEDAVRTQHFFEAARKSMSKRGSWVKLPDA